MKQLLAFLLAFLCYYPHQCYAISGDVGRIKIINYDKDPRNLNFSSSLFERNGGEYIIRGFDRLTSNYTLHLDFDKAEKLGLGKKVTVNFRYGI